MAPATQVRQQSGLHIRGQLCQSDRSTHPIKEALNVTRCSACSIAGPLCTSSFCRYIRRRRTMRTNVGTSDTAAKTFRKLAEQGDPDAQTNLGFMYDEGQGVLQDYAEAVKWYRLAAEQGDAVAQYNLGFMYEMGKGVLQDYAEAVKWYRLAADQGDASAQLISVSCTSMAKACPKITSWRTCGTILHQPMVPKTLVNGEMNERG